MIDINPTLKPYKGVLENIEGYVSYSGGVHICGDSEGHPEFDGLNITTSRVVKAAICYINDSHAMAVAETRNSRYKIYGIEDCKTLEGLCKRDSAIELKVCTGVLN